MRKSMIFLLMGMISALLVLLIVIQILWLKSAASAQKRETQMHAIRALEKTNELLKNNIYCFEANSKVYINPHEGFYMVHQKWDSTGFYGPLDTLHMYVDQSDFGPGKTGVHQFTTGKYKGPVSLEIQLKFKSESDDTTVFYREQKAFREKTAGSKISDLKINNRPIQALIDTAFLDSVIHKELELENINLDYSYGFIPDSESKIVYGKRVADSSALIKSSYTLHLFTDNKFIKPYRLSLLFPFEKGLYSVHYSLFVSIGIILLLTFSFYAFVRLYIRQIRLSEMKSDFINNLTHEFNTPMANISLAIETLNEGGQVLNPKVNKILNIISAESERLRDNIERALQVATMEKGNLQLHIDKFDIVATINTVISAYQLQCEQLGGSISFSHPNGVMISGDETHILNCIFNLLDNAIKYRNGAPVISIQLEDKGEEVIIAVSDNGKGMSNETMKHIFDKFYRAHEGDTYNSKGFGLGLTYVKGIIDAHHGKIEVTSKKDVGTRFIIQLPKSI